MTPEDREFLLSEMRATRLALMEAIAGVDETEAVVTPQGRWSILRCVEHCTLAEEAMFGLMTGPGEPSEHADRSRYEAALFRHSASRSRPFPAPAAMIPTGRYNTLAEAQAGFNAARDRSIAFIEQCPGDLRDRMVQHPIGSITARECLLLLIQHPRRHADQIRELREQG